MCKRGRLFIKIVIVHGLLETAHMTDFNTESNFSRRSSFKERLFLMRFHFSGHDVCGLSDYSLIPQRSAVVLLWIKSAMMCEVLCARSEICSVEKSASRSGQSSGCAKNATPARL